MSILLWLFCMIFLCLYIEQILCKKWRNGIETVVHVNGIRGKSTVVRMIDAALKENGLRSMAKTTGSEAAIVMPNGEIELIQRKAPANIREQLRTLRKASVTKCDYLVIECMAVNPVLQQVSERMLRADVTVITNVKLDHIGVLGYTVEDVGQSLLMSKPKCGVLVTDDYYDKLDENHILVNGVADKDDIHQQNMNTALAVCEILNLNIQASMRGINNYCPDIGHREVFDICGGRFINGFGANDYDSTKILLAKYKKHEGLKKSIFYNNRGDRHYRFLMLLELINDFSPEKLYISGDCTSYVKRKLVHSGFSGEIIPVVSKEDIEFEGSIVIGIGNIKGEPTVMLKEMENVC